MAVEYGDENVDELLLWDWIWDDEIRLHPTPLQEKSLLL